MILSQQTHNDIIEILIRFGGLTAKDIHSILLSGGSDQHITLTQLYNILKLLYNCQIISKYDKKYHINTIRIHQLEELIASHHRDHHMIDWSSLQPGQHILFKASSLAELDPIRGDIFHGLVKQSGARQIYTYNTHFYHVIGMYETEKAFFGSKAYEFYNLVQYQNVLDGYGLYLYQQIGVHHIGYASRSLLFGTEGRVINIIGPYIIDFLMPEILEHYFAYHFNMIQDMSQFNQSQFNSLFQMPIQCQIKVIYDSGLADQYRHIVENQLQG